MPYRVINIYYSVTCYTNHINSTRIQSIASMALMVFPDASQISGLTLLSMTCTHYQSILRNQSSHYQPWISTLAQSQSIPPSPAQVHSCFTPVSLCHSVTPVHDPRSSPDPTPDHLAAFLTFLQPYSSCPALVHFLWTWTRLMHLVSAKSTFDLYLFLIWSSLPLPPVPVSDPLTLSLSLLLFPDPWFIFLPLQYFPVLVLIPCFPCPHLQVFTCHHIYSPISHPYIKPHTPSSSLQFKS